MVWRNLKVRRVILDQLREYPLENLPTSACVTEDADVVMIDGVPFDIGCVLGHGTQGVVHELTSDHSSDVWAMKSFKEDNESEIAYELAVAECGAMLPLLRVQGANAVIMPLGTELGVVRSNTTLTFDEVEGVIQAIIELELQACEEHNSLYTDVKLSNLLLFRSPDEPDMACLMFCDHTGMQNNDKWSCVTYPPPEVPLDERHSGHVKVDLAHANAWVTYWCGLLVARMYSYLDRTRVCYLDHPNTDTSSSIHEYLLQLKLKMHSLKPYDTWVHPNPPVSYLPWQPKK
jgi:hypothetical protein